MHWLHSKLQTIIYTDLSLSALITHFSCLSLSLSLSTHCFSPTFSLTCSSSISSHLLSKLQKIQVTLLNNLSRKSFGSSHQIVHYGLWNHIPQPHLYLSLPSFCLLLSFQSAVLSLKCQEIASVKHSSIVQVYCENGLIFQVD